MKTRKMGELWVQPVASTSEKQELSQQFPILQRLRGRGAWLCFLPRDSPRSLDSKCPSRLLFPAEQSVVLPRLQWARMVAKGLSISLRH